MASEKKARRRLRLLMLARALGKKRIHVAYADDARHKAEIRTSWVDSSTAPTV